MRVTPGLDEIRVFQEVAGGRKHRFCTPIRSTNQLGGENPTPQNRKAHPNEKSTGRTKTIFFSPPAGGEKELEPVQRQQKKFFKKVRSSLDGQGKCVKIFSGNWMKY